MAESTNGTSAAIRSFAAEGQAVHAAVRIAHDGIEFVGRLHFQPDDETLGEVADHAALPGRDVEEVLTRARRLSDVELVQRYRRALEERRRYRALRRATNDVLSAIRRLNEIALAMRAGLIDAGSAAQELDAAERQLHGLIDGLRNVAGDERMDAS